MLQWELLALSWWLRKIRKAKGNGLVSVASINISENIEKNRLH
jgi:hypothetical protein